MKLELKRENGQLILIASDLFQGPNEFIAAVLQLARGGETDDKPIEYSLRNGLGDRKICAYRREVPDAICKRHANNVAKELKVGLEEER